MHVKEWKTAVLADAALGVPTLEGHDDRQATAPATLCRFLSYGKHKVDSGAGRTSGTARVESASRSRRTSGTAKVVFVVVILVFRVRIFYQRQVQIYK